VGGLVIIIMPLIELIRTFTGKDKLVYKEGKMLKIDVKTQGVGA
jgi:hypothetical protein